MAPTVFRILKHITICLFDAFDMIYVLQLRLNYYFANACQCRDLIEIISQADRKIRPKIRAIEDSIRREISNASSGFPAAHSPGDQILPDSQHTTIHGLHRLDSKSEDRFVEWHSYPAKPHSPLLCLSSFVNYRQPMPKGIAFHLVDYLELIDWTGRAVLHGKGPIDSHMPKILQRLNISPEHWIELSTHFESRFKGIVGTTDSLKALCSMFGLSRNTNRSNSRLLFS